MRKVAFEGSVFMTPYTNEYLRTLVRDDRVHRSIYTDPQIFELEMEKIFSRVWIYVGHESQIPNPGDFYCTWVARQPVVMTRDLDGKVHVLFNRCGHRGARVLNEECGNARVFTCMYHGCRSGPTGSCRVCRCAAIFRRRHSRIRNRAWRGCPVWGTIAASCSPASAPTCYRCWNTWARRDAVSTSWSTVRRKAKSNSGPAAIAMNTTATGSSSSKTWPTCTIRRRVTPRRSGPTAVSSHAALAIEAAARRSSQTMASR